MWQESVKQEAKDLSRKICKLTKFINSNQSKRVSRSALELLKLQLKVMKEYHSILVQRIELECKELELEECYTDSMSVFC